MGITIVLIYNMSHFKYLRIARLKGNNAVAAANSV